MFHLCMKKRILKFFIILQVRCAHFKSSPLDQHLPPVPTKALCASNYAAEVLHEPFRLPVCSQVLWRHLAVPKTKTLRVIAELCPIKWRPVVRFEYCWYANQREHFLEHLNDWL